MVSQGNTRQVNTSQTNTPPGAQGFSLLQLPMVLVHFAFHPVMLCGVGLALTAVVASTAGQRLVDPANSVMQASPELGKHLLTGQLKNKQITVEQLASYKNPGASLGGSPTASPVISPVAMTKVTLNPPLTSSPTTDTSAFIRPSQAPQSQALQSQSAAQLHSEGKSWSLPWAFGATAIGCAIGCLLLSRKLNPTKGRNAAKARKVAQSSQGRSALARRPNAAPPVRHPGYAPSQAPQPQTRITVLPEDAVHPLDWGDENLAAQMDLRKQHPVTHWSNP